jgi:hypothetical protein
MILSVGASVTTRLESSATSVTLRGLFGKRDGDGAKRASLRAQTGTGRPAVIPVSPKASTATQ